MAVRAGALDERVQILEAHVLKLREEIRAGDEETRTKKKSSPRKT